MRQQAQETYGWTITGIREEAPKVKTLILTAKEVRPQFISGQYLTVLLEGFEPSEGKSYSISSSEKDNALELTIKEMGVFSKALSSLSVGDTLTTSAPYGFFYPEVNRERDFVFLAGGIGITPTISMIDTLCRREYPKNIFLFYSNRTVADIVFKERLAILEAENPQLQVTHFITREKVSNSSYKEGRMTGQSLLETLQNPKESDFFICGSIDFTKGMWSELRNGGIEHNQLYTEGFF